MTLSDNDTWYITIIDYNSYKSGKKEKKAEKEKQKTQAALQLFGPSQSFRRPTGGPTTLPSQNSNQIRMMTQEQLQRLQQINEQNKHETDKNRKKEEKHAEKQKNKQ